MAGVNLDYLTVNNPDGEFISLQPDQRRGLMATTNAIIDHLVGTHSSRQGVSMTDVNGATLERAHLVDEAQAAVDLEPDTPQESIQNVSISGNEFGRVHFADITNGPSSASNVTIQNNTTDVAPSTCFAPIDIGNSASTKSGYTIEGNNLKTLGTGVALTNVSGGQVSSNTITNIVGNNECGTSSDPVAPVRLVNSPVTVCSNTSSRYPGSPPEPTCATPPTTTPPATTPSSTVPSSTTTTSTPSTTTTAPATTTTAPPPPTTTTTSPPPSGTIALVQSSGLAIAIQPATLAPALGPVHAGDSLVLTSNGGERITSITGGGVTWARGATAVNNFAALDSEVWYGLASSGTSGSTPVTVTYGAASAQVTAATVSEYSGVAAVDTSGTADPENTQASTITAPALSVGAGELVVDTAYAYGGQAVGPTGGFMALPSDGRHLSAAKVSGAAGTYATTWSQALGYWCGAALALRG